MGILACTAHRRLREGFPPAGAAGFFMRWLARSVRAARRASTSSCTIQPLSLNAIGTPFRTVTYPFLPRLSATVKPTLTGRRFLSRFAARTNSARGRLPSAGARARPAAE